MMHLSLSCCFSTSSYGKLQENRCEQGSRVTMPSNPAFSPDGRYIASVNMAGWLAAFGKHAQANVWTDARGIRGGGIMSRWEKVGEHRSRRRPE
jgi:rRNA maturation protein Nop10